MMLRFLNGLLAILSQSYFSVRKTFLGLLGIDYTENVSIINGYAAESTKISSVFEIIDCGIVPIQIINIT